MLKQLTTTQQLRVSIAPTTGGTKPKPAKVENVVWASSNEAVASVVPEADGLAALIVAQGPGDYTVSVSADADLSEGVTTISASDSGNVSIGQAKSIGFEQGEVEEQP